MSRRLLRWFAASLLVLLSLAFAAFLLRKPVLILAARMWIVDEPVVSADAVVILGGGAQYRPFAAAELVRNHVTTNVLLARVRPTSTDQLGLTIRETDISQAVLLRKGVSENQILAIGTNVASTYDEARALRAWVLEHHPRIIIIPTDLFHTRRVNWLMEKQLHDLNLDVRVIALDPPDYSRTNWWQHEEGVIAFQNEIVKYLLYRWRY